MVVCMKRSEDTINDGTIDGGAGGVWKSEGKGHGLRQNSRRQWRVSSWLTAWGRQRSKRI